MQLSYLGVSERAGEAMNVPAFLTASALFSEGNEQSHKLVSELSIWREEQTLGGFCRPTGKSSPEPNYRSWMEVTK